MKTIVIRTVLWTLVVLWMAIIFSFSAETAEESLETSDGIVEVVVEKLLENKKDNMSVSEYESFKTKVSHFVRKAAHFSAYMILGILTLSALIVHGQKNKTKAVTSLGICFLYAVSDEIHQIFVPGRAGRFSDVMIDTAGAVLGVLLVFCITYAKLRLKSKNSQKSGEKI